MRLSNKRFIAGIRPHPRFGSDFTTAVVQVASDTGMTREKGIPTLKDRVVCSLVRGFEDKRIAALQWP